MRVMSYSWVLKSPLLSAMSLAINACFYFYLSSILSSLVLSDISITSSFRPSNISLEISVSEWFVSFSLVLIFTVFFCSIHFPCFHFLWNSLTLAIYLVFRTAHMAPSSLFIPVTDNFPRFHLAGSPDVLEFFTQVNCKKLKLAWKTAFQGTYHLVFCRFIIKCEV